MRTTPFETRILELCEELISCDTDEGQIELAREMRVLLHERLEEIRGNLIVLPMLDELATVRKRIA